MPPNICIINASTVLNDDQFQKVIDALQTQVSRDFATVWDLNAYLKFIPKGGIPTPGYWQLIVLDNSDQAGALGYHDLTQEGLPLGKVFAGTDIQYGNSWTVTMSHELLEMIADPDINLSAQVGDNAMYAYEVCDAVEADVYGYKINDVLVSDFVYPSWFSPSMPGPYDFKNIVKSPLELARGGYISIMYLSGCGGWSQINNDEFLQRAAVGSRRERRRIPRYIWQKSRK